MTDVNPYSTPTAELTNESGIGSSIHEFDRFTAWAVFGLSIITLGIYGLFWYYNRISRLNSFHSEKMNMNLLYVYIVISVIGLPLGFIPATEMVSNLLALASFVIGLVLIFTFRARLLEVLNDGYPTEEHIRVNGILTFFFNIIYIQYKINQGIDIRPLPENKQ